MAYSKAESKNNGDKTSPLFNPFLMGNLSDKCLPMQTAKSFIQTHV